jgi:hypothetical protein
MDIDTHTELETKAGIPLDAVVTHGEMMRAFEAFKETNDERVALSDKRSGDVVLEEKLARLNSTLDAQARRLDEITLKSARPTFGSERAAVRSASALEHKAAFEAYICSGEAAGLRALEVKALSAGSNPDGGYLVPPEVETQIGQRLTAISPIRSIAGVRTISGNDYKKPFMTAGPAVGWVGERPSQPSPSCWPRFAVLSLVRRKKGRARSGKRSQHGIIRLGIMIKRSGAVSFRRNGGIGLLALTVAALHYSPAYAQSADLVLCDRLAAEPADPDKPSDVKGTPVIAPSDIATAIKFCKIASASSRRALYQLGRAYAANRQMAEAVGAYRKAADKGSTSAMVDLGVLLGTGSGVARDEAQARKLFERAAAAGNPRGVANLAALSGGGGAPPDPVQARDLLAKAAEPIRRKRSFSSA